MRDTNLYISVYSLVFGTRTIKRRGLFVMEVVLENWKDIPGYEGLYQVSDMGRVKSLKRKAHNPHNGLVTVHEKILSTGQTYSGHLNVVLCKDGTRKTKLVHMLVMSTFRGLPQKGCEVRHLNSDPTDNRLCNLKYGTRAENHIDASALGRLGRQKLTPDEVREIRKRVADGELQKDLALEYGIHKDNICRICKRKVYSWVD